MQSAASPPLSGASSAAAAPSVCASRCPALAATEKRHASLPDLFLPADGSPSLGYMPLNTPGKGQGVVLDAERAGASFSSQELMERLYGGKESLARRRFLNSVLENDPVFRRWDGLYHSRPERLRRAREKGAALVKHIKALGVTSGDEISRMSWHLGDMLPSELHRSMFTPTLLSQASEEQQKEWLPSALDFRVLGTYAQTELGHGSFVRGLETTATFDPETDEFVCHSPTVTATKWWPGNLGQVTTHCVLMARLITQGKDCGIHAFYLPLRDPKTYKPLPGRTLGDIGPKVGYESNDNGFLRLDHVRIPRSALFGRYVRLTREGVYERVPGSHDKSSYGTMVFVRSMIVIMAARILAQAVTISVRYSAVRRQFPDPASPKGGSEMQVLNYQPQQHTLFMLLSTCFAFHYTGAMMRRLYTENQARLEQGDVSLLAELHATSSGLKSLVTTVTSEGLESCRKCCGGHGYSRMCGISDIWVDYVPAQTYEGDNVVMFLQTARSIVKSFAGVQKGKVQFKEGSHSFYMHEALEMIKGAGAAASKQQQSQPRRWGLKAADLTGNPAALAAHLRSLFAHRAARLLSQALSDLALAKQEHPAWNGEQQWESCKLALVALARAHCQNVLVMNFLEALARMESPKGTGNAKPQPSPAVRRVLRRLCDLFCLGLVEKELGEFTLDGFVSEQQFQWVRRRILALLVEIRPDAIALVDSFDFTDWELCSALGRFDGDWSNTMMEWARRNPLNQEENQPGPGIMEFVQPMLMRGAEGQKAKL